MPWRETCAMRERERFLRVVSEAALRESDGNFAEICRQFGISRRTGYKWVKRFNEGGPKALADGDHSRRVHPNATTTSMVEKVVAKKMEHPTWGPKKVRASLLLAGESQVPAVSTVGQILLRKQLVRMRKWRPRLEIPGPELGEAKAANDIWGIDFKGHFGLGDRSRCYPLTVTDLASRYILACTALGDQKGDAVKQQLEALFILNGLPKKIRSDNGPPFASQGLGGLSMLSVWLIKLGIELERIAPGHPEQNGSHERMHETLKAEATKPGQENLSEQQKVFDQFRWYFNRERPHEALGQKLPAQFYVESNRRYDGTLRSPEYEDTNLVYKLNHVGQLFFKGKYISIAPCLRHEPVEVLDIADDVCRVRWGRFVLAELHSKATKVEVVRG